MKYLSGTINALPPMARRGLDTFIQNGCVACHDGVVTGDAKLRKFGLVEDYCKATGSATIGKGRFDVTQDPGDLYIFRVSSLRNVTMTAPYFHDGSVSTLPAALKIMARVQLGTTLTDSDTRTLVTLLESPTGKVPASFSAPQKQLPPAGH